MATMDGKYILEDDMDVMGRGEFRILRETSTDVYTVVIPNAGTKRSFALGLIDLLNSQGSQVGQKSG